MWRKVTQGKKKGHFALCTLLAGISASGHLNAQSALADRPEMTLTRESAGSAVAAQGKETVRAELIRTQNQTGLTLASFNMRIEIVLFDKRELVPAPNLFYRMVGGVVTRDGTEIAAARLNRDMSDSLVTFRPEGSTVREYPIASSPSICWSYDKSKLAVAVASGAHDPGLQIVDVATSAAGPKIDPMAELTSQCWSPDDKKIVYASGDSIKTYDIEKTNPPPPLFWLKDNARLGHRTVTGSPS
jgi:hypothetical protein